MIYGEDFSGYVKGVFRELQGRGKLSRLGSFPSSVEEVLVNHEQTKTHRKINGAQRTSAI